MTSLALVQVLTSGIAAGCIYGLVALSFVLIYKATASVSFMQGDLLMLGAFAALTLHRMAGWPMPLAAAGAVAAVAALGAVLERSVLRRALGQPHLVAVLLTFGIGMMLRGAVASVPAATQQVHRLPLAADTMRIGELVLPVSQLLVIAGTLALTLALAIFFRCSRAGLALRACAEDARSAALMGVPVSTMHLLAWTLGAALAAAAGLLLAPVTFIHLDMGLVALKAFPAAVLGGLGSLAGALVAGIFLGVIEALAGLFLPEGSKDVVPYLLLLLVLLLFPRGFFAAAR